LRSAVGAVFDGVALAKSGRMRFWWLRTGFEQQDEGFGGCALAKSSRRRSWCDKSSKRRFWWLRTC
jgi:hypothetical protein